MTDVTEETAETKRGWVLRNSVSAVIGIAVITPFTYMLMDREAPYTYVHTEIEPQIVKQKGTIQVTFTVKENRPACGPGLVYRTFTEVDTKKLHTFDPVQRVDPPNIVNGQFTRTILLPEYITPGRVIYRGTACYTCNFIHSWLQWPVCTNTPTGEFTVEELNKQ